MFNASVLVSTTRQSSMNVTKNSCRRSSAFRLSAVIVTSYAVLLLCLKLTQVVTAITYTTKLTLGTNVSVSGQVTKMIAMEDVKRILVAGSTYKLFSIPARTNSTKKDIINYSTIFPITGSIDSIAYIKGGTIVYAASKSTTSAIAVLFGRSKNITLISSTSFTGPKTTITKVNGADVKFVDINKDGYLDIVATIYGTISSKGGSIPGGFLVLFLHSGNNQNPYSSKPKVISESLGGKAVFGTGDCDQNGFIDIPVLAVDAKILYVFYQEKDGITYTQQLIESNITNNYAIDVGNFNGDTGADILTVGKSGFVGYVASLNVGNIYAGYRGFSKNNLFPFSTNIQPYLSSDNKQYQIQIFDADGDGLSDVVTVFGGSATYEVRYLKQLPKKRMTGPNALVSPSIIAPDAFLMYDFNNDGVNDVIAHSAANNTIYVYPGKL
jgi:hypothetical protein